MSSNTLYVGNLPPDLEDANELADLLDGTGRRVKKARLARDRDSGRFKGFAFVEFVTAEYAAEALKLGALEFRGCALRIGEAIERQR
jgi:heterogeneous nuclear ribonucleoprotein A1/A3